MIINGKNHFGYVGFNSLNMERNHSRSPERYLKTHRLLIFNRFILLRRFQILQFIQKLFLAFYSEPSTYL